MHEYSNLSADYIKIAGTICITFYWCNNKYIEFTNVCT